MFRPPDLSLVALICLLVAASGSGNETAGYLTVFADGSHVEGEKITGWHEYPGDPKLDEINLANDPRRLQWLRDVRLAPYRPRTLGPGYVELVGGDRIPGRVVAYCEGEFQTLEAHWPYFVVETAVPVHLPGRAERRQLRVLENALERVVIRPGQWRRLQPGTVFCRDGRQLAFQRIQWAESGVRLLLRAAVEELRLDEINEIHFAARDQWSAYYGQLAALSPDLSAELVRLETTHGFLVTASTTRFRAATTSSAEDPNHWYHMLQPAWSMDRIWIHFPTIRTRWHFRSNEVPLSLVTPTRVEQRSLLGHEQPWQTDRNVRGGTLLAGDRPYGWGLGVHTTNQLWFDLPHTVRGFRSRVGLDRLAGDGGCARAMVYAGAPKGKPLFASPPLVGSKDVHSTGELTLKGTEGGQQALILVADAFHRGRPKGADPLDIRDTVDWLEPLLYLDAGATEAEFARCVPDLIPAWHRWSAQVEGSGSLRYGSFWDPENPGLPRWAVSVGKGEPRLILSSVRRITTDQHWLLLRLNQLVPEARPGQVEVRFDDTLVARLRVPPSGWTQPVYIPLANFQGREVKLEVVYKPAGQEEQIEWLALSPIDWARPVRWTIWKPEKVEASGGATLAPQPDGSVLVSGTLAAQDTYRATGKAELEHITAVRLEALPHDSLPGGGPGRGPGGGFLLTRFRMGTAPPPDEKFEGRYVRIELPGDQRVLSLAEVEVFSGEENIAQGRKVSQSSVESEGAPERAVDGDTTGQWEHGSVTRTEEQTEPWWEVDLESVSKFDRIVVWNRTDYGEERVHQRLANFRLKVLDENRQPVFCRVEFEAPRPSVQIDESLDMEVRLRSADKRFSPPADAATAVPGPHWPIHRVLAPMPTAEGSEAMMFVLDEPMEADGREISFRLGHLAELPQHTLGRFRLWLTSDPPPLPPTEPE
jgi:hypothetical protein